MKLNIAPFRKKIKELCIKHKVTELYLVGSASRDDFNEQNSDIDFMVNFKEEVSLFKDIMPFNMELEKLFNREVDLILTDGKIEENFLKNITKDRIKLYEI